jgi:hypothetical protein
VTSLHGLPLDIVSPLTPDSQRATILFVEGIEWSAGSPQMQHRARDKSRFFPILLVMLDIQACGRAVLLADRVHPSRIAVRFCVLRSHVGAEGALAKRVVEYCVRRAQEVFFRKWCFLGEKNPWPVSHGELCIGVTPSV